MDMCDVTDESAVQAMVAQIETDVGGVDILVNNAGIIKRIPMLEMAAAKGGLKMLARNIWYECS